MTKIDIFSGFLGAGKTTLIKKLISECYKNEKLVLIENEFGEIGVDSGFLSDAGVNITEMNSGCICCSLVGDFAKALEQVIRDYSPDRVIIEPSGVGKLSDVISAVERAGCENAYVNGATCVVDAKKCKMYMKNFGEFFNNQIENAKTIVLSHTNTITNEKLNQAVELIKEKNAAASLITTDWDALSGNEILSVIEGEATLASFLKQSEMEAHHHEHHHHEHHHSEDCDCGCHEHEHHHEHHHSEDCDCGCGEHHHHHHHADEVFTSWGIETAKAYTREQIDSILTELENEEKFGMILRAKGIVCGENEWIYFDYTPGEKDIRSGAPAAIGKLCVIGSKINEENIATLFN